MEPGIDGCGRRGSRVSGLAERARAGAGEIAVVAADRTGQSSSRADVVLAFELVDRQGISIDGLARRHRNLE
jgi:hypothetical protein